MISQLGELDEESSFTIQEESEPSETTSLLALLSKSHNVGPGCIVAEDIADGTDYGNLNLRGGDSGESLVSIRAARAVQDGLQLVYTYGGHRLQLRGLNIVDWSDDFSRPNRFSSGQNYYLSWDSKQLTLWGHDSRSILAANSSNANGNGLNGISRAEKLYCDDDEGVGELPPGAVPCGSSSMSGVQRPYTIASLKYSNQPNFICAAVHVTRMRVFLAAALDMSFKLYNHTLTLVESIRHQERAILQLEYDSKREIIFSAGATGVSVWRLYRSPGIDKAHVMEKLFVFEGCEEWVGKLIFQPEFSKLYAVKEASVQVMCVNRGAVIAILENIHDAPITAVCWYERNQLYLTGCSRGQIKCWTSNYTKAREKEIAAGIGRHSESEGISKKNPPQKTFSLLHTFKGHSRAVTAIFLHPVSGLAVSSGLDGYFRVLNLEALTQLYAIQMGAGIISARIIRIGASSNSMSVAGTAVISSVPQFGCVVSLTDARVSFWKMTSVSKFFAVSTSSASQLQLFRNVESYRDLKRGVSQTLRINPNDLLRRRSTATSVNGKLLGDGSTSNAEALFREQEQAAQIRAKEADDRAFLADHTTRLEAAGLAEDIPYPCGGAHDRIYLTSSTQDVRAFNESGQTIGRLEPEFVVEGIRGMVVSVYQKLLICLCEGDRLRIHCMRKFNFPLVREFSLRHIIAADNPQSRLAGSGGEENGIDEDLAICITIADVAPSNSLAMNNSKNSSGGDMSDDESTYGKENMKFDLRGDLVAADTEAYLYIGLRNGAILILDMLRSLEVVSNFQANNGSIRQLEYSPGAQTLALLGDDASSPHISAVRVYRLLDLQLLGSVSELYHVTSFASGLEYGSLAIGNRDGMIRLYTLANNKEGGSCETSPNAASLETTIKEMNHEKDQVESKSRPVKGVGQGGLREVIAACDGHETPITHVSFLDHHPVFATAGSDGLIKFWTLRKRLLRVVQLMLPSSGVVPSGISGDLLIAQNNYLLGVPRMIWDEEDRYGGWRKNTQDFTNFGTAGVYAAWRKYLADRLNLYQEEQRWKLMGDKSTAVEKEDGSASDDDPQVANDDEAQSTDKDNREDSESDIHAERKARGSRLSRQSISANARPSILLTSRQSMSQGRSSVAFSVRASFANRSDRKSTRQYSRMNSQLKLIDRKRSSVMTGDKRNTSVSRAFVEASGIGDSDSDRRQTILNTTNGPPAQNQDVSISEASTSSATKFLSEQTYERFQKDVLLPALRSKLFQEVHTNGTVSSVHQAAPQEPNLFQLGSLDGDSLFQGVEDSFATGSLISAMPSITPSAGLESELRRNAFAAAPPVRVGEVKPSSKSQNGNVTKPVRAGRHIAESSVTAAGNIAATAAATAARAHSEYAEAVGTTPLNVLHPRHLVARRPPARMLKVTEVPPYMAAYSELQPTANPPEAAPESENLTPTPPPPVVPARALGSASFGLSPRARLTLLSSVSGLGVEDMDRDGENSAALDVSKRMAVAASVQDKLIFGLGIQMQLPPSYAEERRRMRDARNGRYEELSKHASRKTSPPKQPINPPPVTLTEDN